MTPEALPLLAPLALLATAAAALTRPAASPGPLPRLAEGAALAALAVAAVSTLWVAIEGPLAAPGVRLDVVGAPMLLLVGFVGWVVLRFSAIYLDGEPRHRAFTGWLCATLASVLLLVQAGHLAVLAGAWVAMSLCLHRLLLFYPHRAAARRAARKKFVFARAGDAALIAAASLLAAGFGTGDIGTLLEAARDGEAPPGTGWAAALLALAAVLKSAQFPTHGWLTEVMETPTPVSALLHAGVINAGGFLLVRFADVLLLAPPVLAALAAVGGFTALFGGLVMLTQPAVKTSLAWSTVAQMGFMILQCGLALFPLALLHILAHSLYKAHAFLAAGGAVERIAANRRPGPVATPGIAAVMCALTAALALYAAVGLAFGLASKPPQAIVLGAILVLGVAYLLAQGLADAAPGALTARTAAYAAATTVAYFTLHAVATWATADRLPAPPPPGGLEWALMALAVASFTLVAVAQAALPLWAHRPAAAALRVHLANGLYANALLDRLLGGWTRSPSH
ncbi:NADH-quinone oxidoreductase subunit L [Arhodomonas sp. SL1]|uniref:NADH-quinone oxidoreductase subunit L n=1 Tax=Arhodomonas sp. SL1 TaxID=3425691 RepID=UPI003F885AF9